MRFQNKSGVRRAAIQSRLPAGVTAQLRTDRDSDYVFLLNFSGAVARVELDQNGYVDVESGEVVTGQVELPVNGAYILRRNANTVQKDLSLARYVKGKNVVPVSATRIFPDSRVTIFQNDQAKSEKLNIQGNEVYFIQSDTRDKETNYVTYHRIGWRDDHNHLLYEISNNTDSDLGKEDLVKLAEEMITSR
ncbi:Beta-galactosidase C-terminal domain [Paenibacillus amylolyticus]|uniref:Beta-galactosidase C-terminal domain n=1 Tax=Paenibacillus amylolyticus TaxID=1451 RepID=UPI0039AF7E79